MLNIVIKCYKHIGSVHLAISSIDFGCSTDIFHGDLAKVSNIGFAAREPGEIGTGKTGIQGMTVSFCSSSSFLTTSLATREATPGLDNAIAKHQVSP